MGRITGSCSRAGRQAADRAARERAADERGGPEIRGRGGSRGLAKNDIRALAPARAPAARPQIEPPGSEPPTSAAAPRYGGAAAVGGSLKMTLGYRINLFISHPHAREASCGPVGAGPEEVGKGLRLWKGFI